MTQTTRPAPGEAADRPSRLVPIALAGAVVLVLAGGAMFWRATQTATGPERGATHRVTVNQTSCDPMDFTLPAGRTTFEIVNASDRTIEWEILDGVMVVEERENITPGLKSLLTANLRPGTFAITCGLLSNPRGTLVVTPSAASEAARTAPPITAFIGPLSEYKVFLATQSAEMADAVGRLDAAIKADDLDAARAAWLAARLPWKRIEGVTGRIADLDAAINPLPDYLEGREADPAFTGFHRIEAGLWGDSGTEGLAPVSGKLVADTAALAERLRGLKLSPADLAGNAARQAQHLAQTQVSAGEDRWSGADAAEIAAGLDGIDKAAALMQPLAADADPALGKRLTDAAAAVRADLAALPSTGGYAAVDEAARKKLAASFDALGEAVSAINPALGLE